MPSREEEKRLAYSQLADSLSQLGMSDFEQAIFAAVREVFPDAHFYFCLFHLLQTVLRWLKGILY